MLIFFFKFKSTHHVVQFKFIDLRHSIFKGDLSNRFNLSLLTSILQTLSIWFFSYLKFWKEQHFTSVRVIKRYGHWRTKTNL